MSYLSKISFILILVLYVGAGKKEVTLNEGIQPGNLAPDFRLQGMEIQEGKCILLQFWAAYDPQSRVENTLMTHAVTELNADNLQLISISMDENPSVFKGTITSDRLDTTTQWNAPTGKKSAIYKHYRLKNGFGNWLINANGKIVAKNISPTAAEIEKNLYLCSPNQ
ncbi:MAG: thioredoxin family protein [Candidatus Symbiothrix sp.]|jgi:hypothetical protein|nr:thioredoxin family protein [Candidatus Symbiothrix sp.]